MALLQTNKRMDNKKLCKIWWMGDILWLYSEPMSIENIYSKKDSDEQDSLLKEDRYYCKFEPWPPFGL